MEIENKCLAKLSYRLSLAEEGTEIVNVPEDKPAEFHIGEEQLLPKFEANLIGLNEGDPFDFQIKAKDAYGPKDPYAIFDIPKDTFAADGKPDDQMLQVGNTIPMRDNDGNKHFGRVVSVHKDAVTMDFNHPLAGKDLRFVGKVIEIRKIENK
jgi:FKBP-type peptidyl-prolyl cis-trans isomerase SlyD